MDFDQDFPVIQPTQRSSRGTMRHLRKLGTGLLKAQGSPGVRSAYDVLSGFGQEYWECRLEPDEGTFKVVWPPPGPASTKRTICFQAFCQFVRWL